MLWLKAEPQHWKEDYMNESMRRCFADHNLPTFYEFKIYPQPNQDETTTHCLDYFIP